ncbi:MAG TPA: hypothetical protein VG735_16220 [Caulobacterales bacterium]|nr:hypothetical protein [Caulobacterales bacterium]
MNEAYQLVHDVMFAALMDAPDDPSLVDIELWMIEGLHERAAARQNEFRGL